jgi:hypothetical protein
MPIYSGTILAMQWGTGGWYGVMINSSTTPDTKKSKFGNCLVICGVYIIKSRLFLTVCNYMILLSILLICIFYKKVKYLWYK